MGPRWQTSSLDEPQTESTPQDVDARHQPFKTWALQQDLSSLLQAEPDWGATLADVEPPAHVTAPDETRGQAYLRRELATDPEIPMRTRTSVILWTAAIIAGSINQWTSFGMTIEDGVFGVLSVLATFGLLATAFVGPRLKPRQYFVFEQLMILFALCVTAYQCIYTGGATSPFSIWLVQTTIRAAYFMSLRSVIFTTAFAAGAALAPLVYDAGTNGADEILFSVILAMVICSVSAMVFYRRTLTRRAERAEKQLALADQLTGVTNLRGFLAYVNELIDRGERFAIVMVDMNGLKGANAVFGLEVGDRMVTRLASVMQDVSSPNDQVGRIGGDEFAVALTDGDSRSVDGWKQHFGAAINAHNERVRGRSPQISAAVGAALFPANGMTAEDLIDAADREMYAQKSPAVQPPYVIDEIEPVKPIRLRAAVDTDNRTRRAYGPAEYSTQAGAMWLFVALLIFGWVLVPGASVPHRAATVALGFYSLVVAGIGFAGRRPSFAPYSRNITDLATLLVIVPGMWVTGGATSPFQAVGILMIAYYAQFYRGTQANLRIGAIIVLYSAAFMSDAPLTPAEQTLYSNLLTTCIVIAWVLQRNARLTDKSLAAIRETASHDALTGVLNLHAFREALAEAAEGDSGAGGHTALLIADINEFREFNTRAGHRGGDEVLCEVARRLAGADLDDAAIYRIGGDEFAMLLRVERPGEADQIAEEVRRALNFVPPASLLLTRNVSASVGVSVLADGMSAEEFFGKVETALTEIKAKRTRLIEESSELLL